jgi:hypothetical protein
MYKKITLKGIEQDTIKRIADYTIIPFDPANSDYQVYLKWLDGYERQGMEWVKTSDGNTPLPADEPSEGTA